MPAELDNGQYREAGIYTYCDLANGNAPQRVLEEIAARERRAKELETVLARLKVAQSTKVDVSSIRALALARATDLRSTLYSDVGRTR